jgi:hypothetical protein
MAYDDPMKYRNIIKLVVLLAVLAVLIFSFVKLYGFLGVPESRVNLDQSSVVLQIQSLNRLETTSFTIEKIIEAGTNGNAFQNILYGDRILLIAHAEVIAGIDLSKLTDDDVRVDDKTLRITLPAPEILVSRLDNEKTRVYDRKSGLFAPDNKDLESEARAAAESSIRKAACDGGILDTAGENARKAVAAMFISAGFEEVVVEVVSGRCE